MQIRSYLVYKRSTGKLIGFITTGDVAEEFYTFSGYVEHNVRHECSPRIHRIPRLAV